VILVLAGTERWFFRRSEHIFQVLSDDDVGSSQGYYLLVLVSSSFPQLGNCRQVNSFGGCDDLCSNCRWEVRSVCSAVITFGGIEVGNEEELLGI
jgi:hypothetical protein